MKCVWHQFHPEKSGLKGLKINKFKTLDNF